MAAHGHLKDRFLKDRAKRPLNLLFGIVARRFYKDWTDELGPSFMTEKIVILAQ